jgi:formylglycine-generating enzyme required for sulfatase activity
MEAMYDFEPQMVLIPAGEFLMGSDPSKYRHAKGIEKPTSTDGFRWYYDEPGDNYPDDEERPQHTLYLPDYYLAKTPLTNAQYAAFVRATGYKHSKHWKGGELPSGKEDHPVVHVSWYDAVAYCNWLAEVTGRPYRLPSEAEWEKGARGTDGRIYPWGDRWVPRWCKVGGIKTAPVGAYPQGASPYGLLDMAGNVLEWTISLWGKDYKKPEFKYPYDPSDGRENLEAGEDVMRVLRGGDFFMPGWYARCTHRCSFTPGYRNMLAGFRVCAAGDSPGRSRGAGQSGRQ